jgi:hypothetical protein
MLAMTTSCGTQFKRRPPPRPPTGAKVATSPALGSDPRRPEILIPYLVLLFGSIVLMGAPTLRIDKRHWAVTAATSALLIGSMVWALNVGVG